MEFYKTKMEQVKPLDYNEDKNGNNSKECKNINCNECCYRCCCCCYSSSCSNNNQCKRSTKTNVSSSKPSTELPTTKSISVTTTSTTYPHGPFNTYMKTTTTSANGMNIFLAEDMPKKTRKKLKNISSENQLINKKKNLSFVIPNGTPASTKTLHSNVVHEYENIPPPKPKRRNHLPATTTITTINVESSTQKDNNKKKSSRKKYKIKKNAKVLDGNATSTITPLYPDYCYSDVGGDDGPVDNVDNENPNSKHGCCYNTNEAFNNNIKKEYDTKLRLSTGCTSLMYACLQGYTDTAVQELRTKPEKVHRRDRKNKNVLHYCSSCKRNTDLVAAASVAVRAPELLESADEDGFTPLHLAVIQGNLAMVNLLLANKADVNAVDNEGHSVVHWATVCGEIEALRAVLQAGASVTKPDINGGSPLHYAAQMCGAHYEGKLNQTTSSKLALEILTILLSHPQSLVDVTDKDGRQPLLWAASAGSAKAVIALVKAGARVESSDKDGLTALHCAASRGHTECIDTLVSLCGAPTDLIDSNGCTALHYAVTLGHADATSRLLDLEADPNRQDRKGRTPAHCGCAKGQLETVKLLKERGANLWLRNAKGDLPLHEAASSGRRELVEWLLDQRPKQVNTTSNDGRTMLHIAANNDYTDMCKMLIDFGADTNCIYRNSKGVAMTPLDCSLQKGFRSTAKFLQSNGGLPASKLRLSGRHPNAFNDQELVKPLKYAEKEELHDLKKQKKYILYSKRSDSESSGCSCSEHWYKKEHHVNHVCKHHRKRLRRRTSSCGEVDEIGNNDSCSDICRSKSNIEIRRKRSRERVYTSEESDSCEVCCRHKRKLKSKKKERCHQRRYKEITYSEEDDDAKRLRNQKRIEKEKGKYSQKDDSKSQTYNTSGGTKNDEAKDDVEISNPIIEKTQRPQSAKQSRRQQSKEDTFIKSGELDQSLPTTGPLDVTDEDDVQKPEVVITQVQVHSPGEDNTVPPLSSAESQEKEQTSENIKITSEVPIEEISKEVDEVIKDATETVEKIIDKPAIEIDKKDNGELQQSQQEENQVIKTDEIDKPLEDTKTIEEIADKTVAEESVDKKVVEEKTEIKPPVLVKITEEAPADINDSEIGKDMKSITEDVSNKTDEKLPDSEKNISVEESKEEVTTMPSDSKTQLEEQTTKNEISQNDAENKKVDTLSEQKDVTKDATGDNNEKITEEIKEIEEDTIEKKEGYITTKDTTPPTTDKDEEKKLNDNDKEKSAEKSVQIMETEEEQTDTLPSELTTVVQMPLKTPVEREQESRRSFTLLPDSPVAASEVNHHLNDIDDTAIRKSSFTVLKSDESIENYDAQHDELIENDETSFQVVSSSEKPTNNVNRVTYSSDDVAEVGDEEDEEQQIGKTSGPGAIYITNRDGRHSAMAGSVSDIGSGRRKRLKRRVKSGGKGRGWRSVEADEESPSGQQASRDQDSGFEPSPRATTKTKLTTSYNLYGNFVPKKTIYATIDGRTCSSRIEGRKPGDKSSCNMTAVTKSIHRNIRRYYMERKIFQHLLELKSLQIRSSKLNEAVLVKRAVDDYHKSCIALGAETGGSLRRYPYTEYTFKNFEMFLYETLKSLQKPGTYNFQNINEVYEEAERRLSPDYNTYEKALQCTTKTHRCLHAAHAYTGIPCAAYIPMMNHHTMPKFGYGTYKKGSGGVGSFYLPKILTSPVKCSTSNKSGGGTRVSLELSHGKTKQLISLPSDKLDSNKRYYVTFTVKGSGEGTVTGSPGKTKIELSSDGKLVQQTDVTPIEK